MKNEEKFWSQILQSPKVFKHAAVLLLVNNHGVSMNRLI